MARPSWMEPGDDEEYVRISVGTFMRGRTEALGTLEGDGRVPRVGILRLTLLSASCNNACDMNFLRQTMYLQMCMCTYEEHVFY